MNYPNAIDKARAIPASSTFKFVRAFAAVDAPVPPLAIAKSVPLQFELLTFAEVANAPSPRVVRAAAASASSTKDAPNVVIVLVSTLSVFKFVKFASTSVFVRGEPLPDLVTIVAMIYPLTP
jgi:hypothetical protein